MTQEPPDPGSDSPETPPGPAPTNEEGRVPARRVSLGVVVLIACGALALGVVLGIVIRGGDVDRANTRADKYAAALRAVPDSSPNDVSEPSPASSTKPRKSVATSDKLLVGTAPLDFPKGARDEVSVVKFGVEQGQFAGGSLAVVVRNNTDEDVTAVTVSGTARNAAGQIVGSGESQGIAPGTLGPGQLGIGYVYFGSTVPVDAVYAFEVDAGNDTGGPFGPVLLEISEHNRVESSEFGSTTVSIVGTVTNPTDSSVSFPSVMVMCLDEANTPLQASTTSTTPDELDASSTASFSMDVFDEPCPRYLVAAQGRS